MMHYDLIVLGTGGVGSAALYHAARRGLKVLGLDRFPPGHDRGSSHGESRMIRLSYFEHPDYVPLLRRSYALWDALAPDLLQRSGVLYLGPADGPTISGVRESARRYDLRLQQATAQQFPQYGFPAGCDAVFEPDAGWLPVERCVLTHLQGAAEAGAVHRWGETVVGWNESGAEVEVTTDRGSYRGARLVIAGGAWSADLLPALPASLTVTRKHVHWYRCEDARYRNGFFCELAHGQFYGFPAVGGRLKLGEHSSGEPTDDPLGDPRQPDPVDDARIAAFVAENLPGVEPERLQHQTCFYTMSPDSDFIVDRYPGSDRVAFAAGLSGHGFKFAPALGETLVDLVTDSARGLDIAFLGQGRPSLGA